MAEKSEAASKGSNILHKPVIKGREAVHLARKVLEELSNWRQFTDAARRKDLLLKGFRRLKGISAPLSLDTVIDVQKLENDMSWFDKDGVLCGVTKDGIASVIFPENTRISYSHPTRDDFIKPSECNFQVIGPTVSRLRLEDGEMIQAPSEGYQDSEGVKIPFQNRDKDSHPQHGGIFVDNDSGQMLLLNYDELTAKRSERLTDRQVLMEGNWYMDSDNQASVVARSNLQKLEVFNCIGVFDLPNGQKQFFTINTDNISYRRLAEYFGYPPDPLRSYQFPLTEIATLANSFAKRSQAQKWRLVGLEYYDGGTFSGNDITHWSRDFLAVKVGKK
jgi:hypothetical protein